MKSEQACEAICSFQAGSVGNYFARFPTFCFFFMSLFFVCVCLLFLLFLCWKLFTACKRHLIDSVEPETPLPPKPEGFLTTGKN